MLLQDIQSMVRDSDLAKVKSVRGMFGFYCRQACRSQVNATQPETQRDDDDGDDFRRRELLTFFVHFLRKST
jgi:hypothetical protein